jgi:hypothetical protein
LSQSFYIFLVIPPTHHPYPSIIIVISKTSALSKDSLLPFVAIPLLSINSPSITGQETSSNQKDFPSQTASMGRGGYN